MLLGGRIDHTIWGPRHLLAHVQTGKSLGFKIGVKYTETPGETVAVELSE